MLYVDEIVIDANMDLQWPHRMSLMPPSPTCSALIPYRVDLCLEAPCTQLTRSLYPQGWILMPPPCQRCWRLYWWCWKLWRRSWSLDGRWRNPRWVGKALMTHSVVIHAMMMSWYPRRRPSIPTEDILTLGGPLVWFRWLKKTMKPLAWWRSPWRLGTPNEDLDALAKVMEPTTYTWHG